MKDGTTLTFIELFDNVKYVEIPIIQRDFAQGRKEAIEVRSQFLEAIKAALIDQNEECRQPLDLDFIYGNLEGNEGDTFSVLDGQQRLTTLFLLHWYLANRFTLSEQFRTTFVDGNHSRFTYKTRPSTSEFFNALVEAEFSVDHHESNDSLANVIQEQQWFFLSWRLDPTVQSCLRMIDAIQELFRDCDCEIYSRLTNRVKPSLTFQYLNLQSFGLSDELYIKMNSRGIPLTNFENFKAWLFGKIRGYPFAEPFEQKIDQGWTDIFWQISSEDTNLFNRLYLRFFHLMAFYISCERIEIGFNLLDEEQRNWLRNIRITSGHVSHAAFEDMNLFSSQDIERIECVLEYIQAHQDHSVINLFNSVLKNPDYISQAQFYSIVLFITRAPPIAEWDVNTSIHMEKWRRVTNNLINNSRLDELPTFLPMVRALNDLSEHCFELYDYISNEGKEVSGFNKDQWEEECLKASLILTDNNWEPVLRKIEEHIYLQGKVGFLLDMAAKENKHSLERFEECADKAAILFSDKVLRSDEFLLQRALLTFGDYLIPISSQRYSFGLHNRGTYRERSENWLSVVEKPLFKHLIDAINIDVELSLRSIISGNNCEDWRGLIIQNPNVIKYCNRRLIKKIGNQIYLLTKSSFRGWHAELRTFVLKSRLNDMQLNGDLPSFINEIRYEEVYGDTNPGIVIKLGSDQTLKLRYESDKYIVLETQLSPNNVLIEKTIEMPAELKKVLGELIQEEELS